MPRFPFAFFPAELESEFQRYYAEQSVAVARLGAILGAGLYIAFLFWDAVVDPTVVPKAAVIRCFISAYFLGCWVLLGRATLLHRIQIILSLGVSVAAIGVVLIIASMRDGLNVGLSGIVLVMMFNFGFLRLLFWPSLVSGAIAVLAYNAACLQAGLPSNTLIANNFFLISAFVAGATITFTIERLFRRQFLNEEEIQIERARADALMDNMIPRHIADRLKAGEKIVAESHGEATVLFADIVGFTSLTKKLTPAQLVEMLNEIFSMFDQLTEKHRVEKVKTVGDAYMAASGINGRILNSAEPVADFAIDLVRATREYAERSGYPLVMRVGIATGQVISGVIGIRKISYDLWGETVNLASRMETHSEHASIMVTETTYWRLRNCFELRPRGSVNLKGIGPVEAYVLLGRRNIPANDDRSQETSPPEKSHIQDGGWTAE
jgi:class 3 adenylate cyclase